MRWFLLALVFTLIPVSSQAGVFISVGFAPPELPVYDQPPCPDPGLMWTPGYWAYGPDGYFWVPGAWVPAPYDGALWTPPYWGWSGGLFVFHDGYWGSHVGYYGGVNYGYGYGGIGFAGGEWRGHDFFYNTAVMHVDRGRIHGVFEDRGRMERGFVDQHSRVAFSGGPGGIRHDPRPEERFADRDQHVGRTSFQQQHQNAAMGDRNSYVRNNNGRPQNLTSARPLGAESHAQPGNNPGRGGIQNNANPRSNMQPGNNPGRGGVQNNANPRSNMQPGNNPGRGGIQNNANPRSNMQPGNNPGRGGIQNNGNPRSNVQPGNNPGRGGIQNNANPQLNQQRNGSAQQQQQFQQRPQQQQQQRPQQQFQQRPQQQQQQRPAARPQSAPAAAPRQAPAAHSAPSEPKDEHRH
jgi:hypothetical protein